MRAVIGLALAALVLVGCSNGSDEDSGSPTSVGGGASTSESTTTVPAPDATTVAQVLALGRPIVLAHAGGENHAPHSTPYAYASSVAAGVDVLDVDVRLTGDGVLVVHHDADVDRTTDGTGDVADMTYEQLHALDAAYWFTEDCSACTDAPDDAYLFRGVRTGDVEPPPGSEPDDFAVMRFEDLVEAYPDHVLNIEIKGSYPDGVPAAQELAGILTERDKLDAAIVTAFDDELAEAFHELAPEVAITPGLDAMTRYVLADEPLPEGRTIVQIPPEYEGIEVLTPDLVTRTHADGLVLWIWPNEREWENADGYNRLLDLGVDGINAADPPTAVGVVRARG
ncbi:MAG: glycerophosphodiester phosphodiesterase family protein [Microthrixaceae bacterium]